MEKRFQKSHFKVYSLEEKLLISFSWLPMNIMKAGGAGMSTSVKSATVRDNCGFAYAGQGQIMNLSQISGHVSRSAQSRSHTMAYSYRTRAQIPQVRARQSTNTALKQERHHQVSHKISKSDSSGGEPVFCEQWRWACNLWFCTTNNIHV